MCEILFYFYLGLFAETMLCSIGEVTTEYQHPCIGGNCRIINTSYADQYIGLNDEHKARYRDCRRLVRGYPFPLPSHDAGVHAYSQRLVTQTFELL